MNLTLMSKVAARADVFATSIDDDLVLFVPEKGSYFGAGMVGEMIWSLICEEQSISFVCDQLTDQFDVDRETCERDVTAFLAELGARGLITVS